MSILYDENYRSVKGHGTSKLALGIHRDSTGEIRPAKRQNQGPRQESFCRKLANGEACRDTAETSTTAAGALAIPRHFDDEGIRRYGFHGISYEYIAQRLRAIAPESAAGRVIAAHLGVPACAR
jgi:Acetokinase family